MAHDTKPLLSAIVICSRFTEIKLSKVLAALCVIAPGAVVGDWSGPFKSAPSDDQGVTMLSIDGIDLSVLNVDAPLPASELVSGPMPYYLMPDAQQRLKDCRAHVMIMKAGDPASRRAALALARATTLLAQAIAVVTDPTRSSGSTPTTSFLPKYWIA